MDTDTCSDAIQARLRLALRAVMKAKDTVTVSALRSVLAAISNAEAVHRQDGDPPADSRHVAGAGVGLAADTERRMLTPEETVTVVKGEVSDRQAAARYYEAAGRPEPAARLRREAQVIQSVVGVRLTLAAWRPTGSAGAHG